MKSKNFSVKKMEDTRFNISQAKEFFSVIDDNDSGQASLYELATPLIALGISSDSSFVKKVMRTICPRKFGAKSKFKNPYEHNELSLKEFLKIFKKDQVSENLTLMLCNKIIERK